MSFLIGMDNETARIFWNNVQANLNGKTFKSVCEEAGLNYLSVANRKSGKTPSLPRLESAYLLAKTLGVSIEYLLTGEKTDTIADRVHAYMLENMPGTLQDILGKIEKKDGSSGRRAAL